MVRVVGHQQVFMSTAVLDTFPSTISLRAGVHPGHQLTGPKYEGEEGEGAFPKLRKVPINFFMPVPLPACLPA
jgi:hypothetical protein